MIRRRSLSMLGIEGDEDMVITTFIVPENADRSLRLTEQSSLGDALKSAYYLRQAVRHE